MNKAQENSMPILHTHNKNPKILLAIKEFYEAPWN
jgi:hypothetical protein